MTLGHKGSPQAEDSMMSPMFIQAMRLVCKSLFISSWVGIECMSYISSVSLRIITQPPIVHSSIAFFSPYLSFPFFLRFQTHVLQTKTYTLVSCRWSRNQDRTVS